MASFTQLHILYKYALLHKLFEETSPFRDSKTPLLGHQTCSPVGDPKFTCNLIGWFELSPRPRSPLKSSLYLGNCKEKYARLSNFKTLCLSSKI